MTQTKKIVMGGLLAAFTCVATSVIKYPTPTLGYIHLGDGLVLLCGVLLGPLTGALAAGIGSALSDLIGGYAIWAPGTFIIKALCAMVIGIIFNQAKTNKSPKKIHYPSLILGGVIAEAIMVLGYYLYEILISVMASGASTTLHAAAAASATGIIFNVGQGITGVVICTILVPVLCKIPDIRQTVFPGECN